MRPLSCRSNWKFGNGGVKTEQLWIFGGGQHIDIDIVVDMDTGIRIDTDIDIEI